MSALLENLSIQIQKTENSAEDDDTPWMRAEPSPKSISHYNFGYLTFSVPENHKITDLHFTAEG